MGLVRRVLEHSDYARQRRGGQERPDFSTTFSERRRIASRRTVGGLKKVGGMGKYVKSAESRLFADGDEFQRGHVPLGNPEPRVRLDAGRLAGVPVSRFGRDAHAAVLQRLEDVSDHGLFLPGVVEGIEEKHAVEFLVKVHLLEVADQEPKIRQVVSSAVFLRPVNHVLGNVHARHVVAAPGQEDAGPAGAAADIQQPGRRRRQKPQHRAHLGQIPGAVGVGKRLVKRMQRTKLSEVSQIIFFRLLAA